MFHYTVPQLYSLATQKGEVALRLKIVKVCRECGSIGKTARMSRNTVRKWVRRYRERGEAGLYDRPRRPKRPPAALYWKSRKDTWVEEGARLGKEEDRPRPGIASVTRYGREVLPNL
jgi:transposase